MQPGEMQYNMIPVGDETQSLRETESDTFFNTIFSETDTTDKQ